MLAAAEMFLVSKGRCSSTGAFLKKVGFGIREGLGFAEDGEVETSAADFDVLNEKVLHGPSVDLEGSIVSAGFEDVVDVCVRRRGCGGAWMRTNGTLCDSPENELASMIVCFSILVELSSRRLKGRSGPGGLRLMPDRVLKEGGLLVRFMFPGRARLPYGFTRSRSRV